MIAEPDDAKEAFDDLGVAVQRRDETEAIEVAVRLQANADVLALIPDAQTAIRALKTAGDTDVDELINFGLDAAVNVLDEAALNLHQQIERDQPSADERLRDFMAAAGTPIE